MPDRRDAFQSNTPLSHFSYSQEAFLLPVTPTKMALRPAPVESTPKSDSSSLFVWLIAVLCFILVAIFAATLHNYRWYSKELVDSDEEESEYLVKCSVCCHASSVSAEEVLIEMVLVSKIGTFCFLSIRAQILFDRLQGSAIHGHHPVIEHFGASRSEWSCV